MPERRPSDSTPGSGRRWLLPTVNRTAKPRLCEDCPIPATGPKLRVAEPRIVVLLLTA